MILFLFSQQTRGQAALRLVDPASHHADINPFFGVALQQDTLKVTDTLYRVAHIHSGTQRVLSFKLALVKKDTFTEQYVVSHHVYDSVKVPSFPTKIDSGFMQNYRVTIVNTTELDKEYPIETARVYGRRALKILPPVKIDSLLPALPKGPLVELSGTLVTTAQAANTSYTNQTVPQNYVRQSAVITAKIAGIPFTTSYLASTEGGLASNNINNLGFSIDFNSVKQAILKELAAQEKKKRDSLLAKQGIPTEYEKDLIEHELIRQKIDSLKNKLTTPDYRNQLTADSLTMLEITDTSELDYRHKISKKRLETDSLDQLQLKDYQLAFDRFESIRKRRELVAAIETPDLKLSRELDTRGYNPIHKMAIKSVRRIEIGNFIPQYSELVLSGTNVTGINLELNPGKVYLAGMAGQQKVQDMYSPTLAKRNIRAAKIGAGNPDKLLFTFTLLAGEVTNPATTAGETIKGNEHRNLTAGLQLVYQYNNLFNTVTEYARSVSKFNDEPKPELKETVAKESFGNAAYSTRIYGATADNKTRYSAEAKFIEPYFNSFGTPNLRKDNFRYELRLNQALIKNNITGGVSYTHDNDNVSNTKSNTSTQNRLTLTLNIRYKKAPYVVMTYSPARQKVQATGGGMLYTSTLHFVTVSSGYNQKTNSGNTFTNATYSFFTSSVTGMEAAGITMHQLMLANTTFFRESNRNLKSMFSTYRYSTNDSISGMRAEVGLDKTNKTGTFTYEFGLGYQWDKNIETRYIVYGEVRAALKYRISISARLEEHLLSNKNQGINDQAQLGRLMITKIF